LQSAPAGEDAHAIVDLSQSTDSKRCQENNTSGTERIGFET
jgi:hypothetical protein